MKKASKKVHERPFAHGYMGYGHIDIHAPLTQPDLEWARKNHCIAGVLGERYLRSFGGAPMRGNDVEENLLSQGEKPGSRVLFEALLQAEIFPDDELSHWTALTLGSFHRFMGLTSVEATAAAAALDAFERTQIILDIARMLDWLSTPVTPEYAAAAVAQFREWGMPAVDFLRTGTVVLAEACEAVTAD